MNPSIIQVSQAMFPRSLSLLIVLLQTPNALAFSSSQSFLISSKNSPSSCSSLQLLQLHATTKLSELPKGISPFERGNNNSNNNNKIDLASQFRATAARALDQARRDGKSRLLEIEFPPLLFKGKTLFDDFDNVQELDLNRDWCIEWLPQLLNTYNTKGNNNNNKNAVLPWLILPDLKECELAKQEWRGGRYRDAAKFTTIEAVTRHYARAQTSTVVANDNVEDYKKPWGATFASAMSSILTGGEDLLGDSSALDELEGSPDIHIIWYVNRCHNHSVQQYVCVCMYEWNSSE